MKTGHKSTVPTRPTFTSDYLHLFPLSAHYLSHCHPLSSFDRFTSYIIPISSQLHVFPFWRTPHSRPLCPLPSPPKLYFFPWDLKATTNAEEVIVLVMSMQRNPAGEGTQRVLLIQPPPHPWPQAWHLCAVVTQGCGKPAERGR